MEDTEITKPKKEDVQLPSNNPNSHSFYKNLDKQFVWIIGAGLSLFLFVIIIVISYSLGEQDTKQGAIPIIKADNNIKTIPEDRGGKKFPYQQMNVYDHMKDGYSEESADVSLRPEDEKPLSLSPAEERLLKKIETNIDDISSTTSSSIALDTLEKEDIQEKIIQAQAAQKKEAEQQKVQKLKEQAEAQKKALLTKKLNDASKTTTQKQVQKQVKAVSPPVIQTPSSHSNPKTVEDLIRSNSKSYQKNLANNMPHQQVASLNSSSSTRQKTGLVQLGAYRSQSEARNAWRKIQSRFPQNLGDKTSKIVKADLGSRGIFYRLRIALPGGSSKTLCSALKKKSQACIVIKP